MSAGDLATADAEAKRLTPARTIDVLERLPARQRAVLYRLLPKQHAADVFEDLPPVLQKDLISSLQDEEVAAAFADLEPDDRVALLDEVPAPVAARLMQGLSPEQRELTADILGYPKKSIGRRMSPEVFGIDPEVTASWALSDVKRVLDFAETVYTLPVTDPDRVLLGVVSLRDLMKADPQQSVASIMRTADFARATDSAEDAARRCADSKHLALPVVDNDRRLVGILTVDDALDILEEADSEDQARIGGAETLRQPYLTTSVATLVRTRVVWLLVLAIGAALTVQVLDTFESTLAEVVTLALFVPLLIGTGGNTGNQAATTVTRALALQDVTPGDIAKVLGREFRVGLCLGLILGTVGFTITSLLFDRSIGTVIGLTLLSVCTMAATVGGAMPLLAKAVRADPAVFSNPFITTFVDASGLVVYFLIAKAVLHI
ncbi:MAG: magnesium transporter [Mycobacteriaceae bacterium]